MASQPDGSPVTPTPRHRQSGVERPFALHPPGMALGAGSSHHYRFSEFDEGAFSESSGVSADQAKRALRAHLAETERRMAEAGRLGTSLVQQQKDLTEKLREVEGLQAESELSPELKKKLAELEKEYDDVARETARAFLPKQRIPSNESTGSPEGKGGRRSLSPVKYESHASASPSKLTVSNRKQRNQATNRVHDIEFAAEISTSLISQVRGLQALLSEREEELRDVRQDVARLEDNGDSLRERIKELDESEHRYKEENWNLETRIHEFEAAQRDAADTEKKVSQQLATLVADKTKAQRELDELKASHSRLVDDHAASVKLHDIELGTAKRNMAMADTDKASLQKKIDELASQNQELARAVSMQQRARAVDNDALASTSEDDFDTATDNGTPDHSPPASPVKGTPRHSVLETETLKTSLLHSQRTLQSLRTNLHREKTEKLELRRMLQDARDELERSRFDPNSSTSSASKKNRKEVRDVHNRLRPSQLGGARTSRTDLFTIATTDPDWEELQGEASPSSVKPRAGTNDTSDQFDTANEAQLSDTSFATAKDGADTADDFHTGAEDLSSGEDTMTETEKDTTRRRTLIAKASTSTAANGESSMDMDADPANQSTASTSDDDDDYSAPRTPTASLSGSSSGVSRMRLRVSRSSLASRRLRHMSSVEEAGSPGGLQGSPFSGAGSPATLGLTPSSNNSTPRVGGLQQSLFAELGELGEDSDDEVASDGTPSRFRSPRIMIPSSFGGSNSSGNSVAHSPLTQVGHSPRVVMVDRSTLTDAVTIMPWSKEDEENEAAGYARNVQRVSRPSSIVSYGADNMDETLKEFPSPPSSPPKQMGVLTPILLSPPEAAPSTRSIEAGPDATEPAPSFTVSELFSVPIEPIAEPELPQPSPVLLGLSAVQIEHVTPEMPPTPEPVEPPVFSASALHVVDITPIELPPPVVPIPVPVPVVVPKEEPPVFSLSALQQQVVEPIEEPEPEQPAPEILSVSGFHSQHIIPIAEPEPEVAREVPVVVPVPEPLSFSGFQTQHVQPIAEPEPEVTRAVVPTPEPLSLSTVQIQHVEPVAEPEPEVATIVIPAPEPLSFSGIQIQNVEPVAEPQVQPAPLPEFSYSTIQAQHVMPIATPEKPVPAMDFSSVFSQHVQPVIVEEPEEEAVLLPIVSSMATQTDEWKPEPSFATIGAVGVGAGLLGAAASSSSIDEDLVPRSPKRNGFIMPREFNSITALDGSQPSTPDKGALSSVLGWSKLNGPSTPVIAEDETRQSPNDSPMPETPESQRPFKEITANGTGSRSAQHHRMQDLSDDKNFLASSPPSVIRTRPHSRGESQDSNTGSIIRGKQISEAAAAVSVSTPRRPGSASSNHQMTNGYVLPPLPPNHREVIEAARSGSAGSGAVGDVVPSAVGAGPSTWRVHTPTGTREPPVFAPHGTTPTPKANIRAAATDARPPSRVSSRANISNGVGRPGTLSRQTSMSSFASEVDARFNIHDGTDVFGTGNHTDPRMIQAITQTMIGEYLWKYTRKTGRSGLSENRHRRYFWIHPYTRMLYWSDHGPTAGNRAEQRAKSVVIEGVRVVTDDNPMPPGLHRKSLIVISPGRTIKFTCPTGHRHEIWFNALSYLLLRNDEVPDDGTTAGSDHITREDVEEFNPSFGPRVAAPQPRRPPLSLSSYNSRTTRNESPAFDVSMNIPTLTPTPKKNPSGNAMTPSTSAAALSSRRRLSRIGSYWRSSQSLSAQFNSLRGRNSALGHRQPIQGGSIFEASEVNDSAEELRALYEAQDRAADRLENVRACCDGKHDVGNLHHHSSRRHRHSQGVSSVMSTPTHSTRTRV
ncbi:anucleate primary sterigmata protein a [Ophiostoma piceae UAMH 11346]|uniref:Anucleate primary sterigmata protein a n=1 Tax=Ophiostoma piceae (strain UAMH 11346) TaxID=1262450 RepID=S3CE36_OPHP1|nr:anucleate primary sterigmata protein a [Ophiostoma piceae UAMH 11346]